MKSDEFSTFETAQQYLETNPDNLSMTALMRLAELANTKRTENAAYYTNKSIITEIMKRLPDVNKSEVRILEPSVGVGNFLPQIIHRFQNKQITIDVVDIDERSLETLKLIQSNLNSPTEDHLYEFGNLLTVLSVGFDDEGVLEINENDYADVIHAINYHYEAA